MENSPRGSIKLVLYLDYSFRVVIAEVLLSTKPSKWIHSQGEAVLFYSILH
jgi:hypothetical protein